MDDLTRLRTDGYVVAEDLLDASLLKKLRRELEPHFGAEGWGRNEFEGLRTMFYRDVDGRNPIKLIPNGSNPAPAQGST